MVFTDTEVRVGDPGQDENRKRFDEMNMVDDSFVESRAYLRRDTIISAALCMLGITRTIFRKMTMG